jgi:preprotein translocase subunit YajC
MDGMALIIIFILVCFFFFLISKNSLKLVREQKLRSRVRERERICMIHFYTHSLS